LNLFVLLVKKHSLFLEVVLVKERGLVNIAPVNAGMSIARGKIIRNTLMEAQANNMARTGTLNAEKLYPEIGEPVKGVMSLDSVFTTLSHFVYSGLKDI
jgi:hypothetical protein